jgi:Tfp pilus assembly protein PilN
MRVPINLASEPFRRDRPMLVGSAVCAVLLAGLLVLQIFLIRGSREEARDARMGVAQLSQQLAAVSAEQAKMAQTLKQPGNAQVFQRSLLLNALVERKSISWTRIFADLEHVKPYNVRVIQIRLPKIHSRQEVTLDMTVGMEDWTPSQDFMDKLAASPLFGPVLAPSWEAPSQNQKLYQYHWTVVYGQKL